MKTKQCIYLDENQLAEAGLSPEDVGVPITFTLMKGEDGTYELERSSDSSETESETESEDSGVADKAVSAEDPQDAGVDTTSPALDGQPDSPAGEEDILGYTRPKKKSSPKINMKSMRGSYRME